ncbi:MAG: sortase domain-containing protein [Streptosporangiaceae bacterium]
MRRIVLLAIICALIGGGIATACGLNRHAPPSLPRVHATARAHSTEVPLPSPPAVAVSRPVRIVISSIGVSAPVEAVGLCPEAGMDCSGSQQGGLAAPPLSDSNLAGWYGGYPGQSGFPVVIDGHVDNPAPAVFWKISEGDLGTGATVDIDLADGTSVTYVVTSTETVPKTGFPLSVYNPTKTPTLVLITCGGQFDAATGHYLSNVVAFATLA